MKHEVEGADIEKQAGDEPLSAADWHRLSSGDIDERLEATTHLNTKANQMFFRHLEQVDLSGEEAGQLLVEADPATQADFLVGLSKAVTELGWPGNWSWQCGHIAQELGESDRLLVVNALRTLIDAIESGGDL